MADVIVTSPRGLQTETGNIAGPEPQLTRADNVITRRPGLIEPRGQIRGYLTMTSATAVGDSGYVRHARRWRPEDRDYSLLYYWTGEASDTFRVRPLPYGAMGGGFVTTGRTQEPRSADLGDRQAWTLDCGVGMLDGEDAVISQNPDRPPGAPRGVAPALQPQTGGTPDQEWIPATGAVAYRVCFVTYENGIPLRSAPSARVVFRQDGGAACYLRVYVSSNSLLGSGGVVEIYRTQLTTVANADPGDEMRLRYSATAGEWSALGYFDDVLDDDAWNGPYLYTNETQQGIAQENGRPNLAVDIATYNGMTFYAGTESHPTLTATLRTTGSDADPQASMQSVAFDAVVTVGNTTIASVTAAAFDYLAVGQVITLMTTTSVGNIDGYFPALTKIVSFDAGAQTITIDQAPIGGGVGAVALVAWDWFSIRCTSANWRTYVYASITADFATGSPPAFSSYFGQAPIFLATPSQSVSPYWSGGAGDVVRAYDQSDGSIPIDNAGAGDNVYIRMMGADITAQIATASTCKGMLFRWYVDVHPVYESTTLPSDCTFDLTSTKPAAWDVGNTAFTADVGVPSVTEGGSAILSYSKLYEPEALPPVNYVQVGKASYPIRRIVATTDSLWIFKGDGLWRMYGSSPESLSLQQVDPTCQLFGRQTQRFDRWVTKFGDTVFAWTSRGIVAVSSNGVQQIDADIRSLVRRYTPTQGQTVTYPWSWSSLQTGTVCFGFAGHEYSDTPLGFSLDVVSGTWTTLRTDQGGTDTDVLTVHYQPVTINDQEVTI